MLTPLEQRLLAALKIARDELEAVAYSEGHVYGNEPKVWEIVNDAIEEVELTPAQKALKAARLHPDPQKARDAVNPTEQITERLIRLHEEQKRRQEDSR